MSWFPPTSYFSNSLNFLKIKLKMRPTLGGKLNILDHCERLGVIRRGVSGVSGVSGVTPGEKCLVLRAVLLAL